MARSHLDPRAVRTARSVWLVPPVLWFFDSDGQMDRLTLVVPSTLLKHNSKKEREKKSPIWVVISSKAMWNFLLFFFFCYKRVDKRIPALKKICRQVFVQTWLNLHALLGYSLLTWLVAFSALGGRKSVWYLEGAKPPARQMARYFSCFQSASPDHFIPVWTAVFAHISSTLADLLFFFCPFLSTMHKSFSLLAYFFFFLTWPAVLSTCACLEQYISFLPALFA